MKYMVMECHPGYAVVLDEKGQFFKVANLCYEVGQTVTDVVELSLPKTESSRKKRVRWVSSLAAVAACTVLLFTFLFSGQITYASVYLSINPQVRIDVNRNDKVVGLSGVNEDGKVLISDYRYQNKSLDLVVHELVEMAIEQDYLHEGGKVSLELDARDNEWVVSHSNALDAQIHDCLTDRLTVTVEVTDKHTGNHGTQGTHGQHGPGTSTPATSTPGTSTPATSTPATSTPVTSVPTTSVPATSIPITDWDDDDRDDDDWDDDDWDDWDDDDDHDHDHDDWDDDWDDDDDDDIDDDLSDDIDDDMDDVDDDLSDDWDDDDDDWDDD